MTLRAKRPEAVSKRLKCFVYSEPGCGKTTFACSFPKAYLIDGERGAENYDKLIAAAGSVVFQTTDMREVVAEVRSLLTEKHDYRTLVIDPLTTIYNDLIDRCEQKTGSEFGRHVQAANKEMKRLSNLLMQLDLNVVVTSHAKREYGTNMAVVGQIADCWKQAGYIFDLVLELSKKGKKRFARVVKTRIATFPDDETFEWSYEAVKQRYDAAMLEKASVPVSLASTEQVRELQSLLAAIRLPDGTTEKWLSKAGVDSFEDMPADVIEKCAAYCKARVPLAAEPRVVPVGENGY